MKTIKKIKRTVFALILTGIVTGYFGNVIMNNDLKPSYTASNVKDIITKIKDSKIKSKYSDYQLIDLTSKLGKTVYCIGDILYVVGDVDDLTTKNLKNFTYKIISDNTDDCITVEKDCSNKDIFKMLQEGKKLNFDGVIVEQDENLKEILSQSADIDITIESLKEKIGFK